MAKWGSWIARAVILAWVTACFVGGVTAWTDHVPVVIATPPPADAPQGTLPVEAEARVAFSCAAPFGRDEPATQRDESITIVATHREPCSYRDAARTMIYVDVALAAIGLSLTLTSVRRRAATLGSRVWRALTGRTDRPATAVTPPV